MISIIVPIYNSEFFLHRCIDSILNQSYFDFELLLVNDGSTDSSLLICNQYASVDKRVRVFSKENGGQGSARNKGIKESRGKYITFIDSDDFVPLNYLEVLRNNIRINGISIVGYKRCKNSENKFRRPAHPRVKTIDKKCILQKYFSDNSFTGPWGKLFPKDLFEKLEFPSGIYEDFALLYRVFEKAESIIYCNESVYFYFVRNDSTTKSKYTKKNFIIFSIFKEMEDYLKANNKSRKDFGAFYNRKLRISFKFYLNSYESKDLFLIKKSDELVDDFRTRYWFYIRQSLRIYVKILLTFFCISPLLFRKIIRRR